MVRGLGVLTFCYSSCFFTLCPLQTVSADSDPNATPIIETASRHVSMNAHHDHLYPLYACLYNCQFDIRTLLCPTKTVIEPHQRAQCAILTSINFPNPCSMQIITAVKSGVNVVIWFAVNLIADPVTGLPTVSGRAHESHSLSTLPLPLSPHPFPMSQKKRDNSKRARDGHIILMFLPETRFLGFLWLKYEYFKTPQKYYGSRVV